MGVGLGQCNRQRTTLQRETPEQPVSIGKYLL